MPGAEPLAVRQGQHPDLVIVVVPLLRPLRGLRSTRLLRLLRLGRLVAFAVQGLSEARRILRRRAPPQAAKDQHVPPAGPARRPGRRGARRAPTRQDHERRRLGPAWDDHHLVFPNTVGRPLHPRNFLRRDFYLLLERAGLPRIRFHDLRHSAATLLLGLGIHPEIVSELLGHTQVGITLDLYSDVTATMQREAVRAFDAC